VITSEDRKKEYIEAYQVWQEQLQALHRVVLGGQRIAPPRLKGLLNREVRAKEKYEEARRRLLGLGTDEE
jgi:hypothetical protein